MKNLTQVTVKRSIMRIAAAAMLTLAVGSVAPRQAHAQSITSESYFDYSGVLPALYVLNSDHTGARTTYPTGNLEFGSTYAFAWSLKGTKIVFQYTSGYTEIFEITTFDPTTDTIYRNPIAPAGLGNGPWYGCGSGKMPTLIQAMLCQ